MEQQYRINKIEGLQGAITIPSSKSHTLRAILFATLAQGKSVIWRYLPSSDTFAMIDACRLLGANIEIHANRLEILGIGGSCGLTFAEDVINAGNSGIVLRFLAAIGALMPHPIVITGDHSIRHQRPMHSLLAALRQLGAAASSMRGDSLAPVIIQGPITGRKAIVEGQDSQPVSALLIAAAFAKQPITIEVLHPGEKPWVALTLHWFDRLGISYQNHGFTHYQLQGHAHYSGFEYVVPGDLSSAAFPLVAALITNSELVLNNVDMQEVQGDKALIYTLQQMGGKIEIDEAKKALLVKKGSLLRGTAIDINDFIDAITIMAVAACFAQGQTYIHNAAIARQKECNRLSAITLELSKMGAQIEEVEEGLRIQGTPLHAAQLYTHGDHRMVMSLSIAALAAKGQSLIAPIGSIAKTYPSFCADFNALGANIIEEQAQELLAQEL